MGMANSIGTSLFPWLRRIVVNPPFYSCWRLHTFTTIKKMSLCAKARTPEAYAFCCTVAWWTASEFLSLAERLVAIRFVVNYLQVVCICNVPALPSWMIMMC